MLQSIFTGLSLVRSRGRIDISYPRALRSLEHARDKAAAFGLTVQAPDDDPAAWRLRLDTAEAYPASAKAFFAELTDSPAPYPPFDASALVSGAPAVSCIVVVNENAPFVSEQLLPSLAACSGRHAIEIILVHNGSPEPADIAGVRAIRSEWGAVSKAYNAGAAMARAPVLAFFHDDCIVHDRLWIQKCLQRLERGADAVAAEYRQIDNIAGVAVPPVPVAKCVPLVLRRSDFHDAGGFDEQHYIGYEDLDFTLALARRGKRMVATDMQVLHFHGMSSTLKYSPAPGLADLYAFGAVPRVAIMQRFREFWSAIVAADECHEAAMDAQILHVLAKYADVLTDAAYGMARDLLQRRLERTAPSGPRAAIARLRDLESARR